MYIDSYSFGNISINGKTYRHDVIIFPERVQSGWWRAEGHLLAVEDLKEVFEYLPEVLIVGTGASGNMEVPKSTRKYISEREIDLIVCPTENARERFNQLISEGRKVVGAFHLTC
jgi:hypothetical protein